MLRRKSVVYVTDRGHEFAVEEMKASHLLNTISHLQKQSSILANLINSRPEGQAGHLLARLEALQESELTLANELAQRDPAKDEAYEDEYCDSGSY